ncbi:MAG: SNF2-related protein [Deltaproteobacteria bacterium]|nr:SNF2-related protein [Deltaproteobacteria bacterium]
MKDNSKNEFTNDLELSLEHSKEIGPSWKVESAVAAFKEHIQRKHRKPDQNYSYFLKEFDIHFRERNVAEITPEDIEEFLFSRWGNKAGSTWNLHKAHASSIFSFCITDLKNKGLPLFHNPCALVKDVQVEKKDRKFIVPAENMKQLLNTFATPHHWLMFHILVTAGLGIEELLCLRPVDVNGRTLKLATYSIGEKGIRSQEVGPKSGKFEEYAVIPQVVADRLKVYMQGMSADKPIFHRTSNAIRAALETHCKQAFTDKLTPHDLRKWCTGFWEQNNDPAMMHFVLRPSLDARSAKYLTELSVHEVMARQDLIMVPELIGNSPTGYIHDFYQSTDSKPNPNAAESLDASSQNQNTDDTTGRDKPFPYGDPKNDTSAGGKPGEQEQANNTGISRKAPEIYSTPSTCDSNISPVPPFHQTLLAHELTLKRASNDMRKLESSLSAAMVDLNPHQIDAALFAFKGPMSTGALLCDEVGLGKTIEAGLIISQLWAEGRRRIIAVVPATIRKQWQNELLEKFGIPCVIVDGFEYRQAKKSGMKNPFDREELVIVSLPFASMKAQEIGAFRWDLVVIDEAHRLRNVYRKSGNKQAKKLKEIFAGQPKILLTATPLQNSLMELYGLVSFIDDRIFGSEYAFRTHFIADSSGHEANNLEALKRRLAEVVTRTIRRQVREYIPYTNRISMVEDFTPTDAEFELYELVSEYLQRPELAAIPHRQRHLMVLIYRKILASSSFAIAGTLQKLVDNLDRQIKGLEPEPIDELVEDVDGFEEEKEELAKTENGETIEDEEDGAREKLRKVSLELFRVERDELLSMKTLAQSIHKNAKGDALLVALEKAFAHAESAGWNKKAVIFTESRRTQEYLLRLLSENGYRDRITIFNGSNEGPTAKRAYAIWEKERPRFEGEIISSRTATIREALIHEFKHHTKILIATEAGAEGINLQFSNIVINYDLPWNPQRVEQRIGRCHRYGQKNDVVAMNFLNRANAADMRVFELLDKKFRLFSGVFGASDEILGAIGSGVDFERRILDIYQSCRTEEEINTAFDSLQAELSEEINQRILETRRKLLEHFDDEVRARFKVINSRMKEDLSTLDTMLARLVISALDIKNYEVHGGVCRMFIGQNPTTGDKTGGDKPRPYEIQHSIDNVGEALVASRIGKGQAGRGQAPPPQPQRTIQQGWYYIGRHIESANADRIHVGHQISKAIIESIKKTPQELHAVRLCYTKGGHRITTMEPYLGKIGAWFAYKLSFEGLDTEEHLVHIVCVKDGNRWTILDKELTQRFPAITAEYMENKSFTSLPPEDMFEQALSEIQQALEEKIGMRNEEYYESELDKLDLYSDEVLMEMSDELKKKEAEIGDAKKRKLRTQSFEDKSKARKEILNLERECSNITEKLAQEKRRLFEEKEKEAKRLEKKLKLKVQRTCVARAVWEMA